MMAGAEAVQIKVEIFEKKQWGTPAMPKPRPLHLRKGYRASLHLKTNSASPPHTFCEATLALACC